MPTFVAGKDSYISVDAVVITSFVDSWSDRRRQGTAEVTALGDADDEFIATVKGGSTALSGHWEAATLDAAMVALFDGAEVAVEIGPAGNGSGAVKITYNALPEDYEISGAAKEKVNWATSLVRNGAVTVGTY